MNRTVLAIIAAAVTVAVAVAFVLLAGNPVGGDDPTPLVAAEDVVGDLPILPVPSVPPPPDPDLIPTGWGPSEGDWQRALATAESLSVEEAAGQVIITTFSGVGASAPSDLVHRFHVGGVIFFGGNVGSTSQIRAISSSVNEADDRDWPVMLSVDQEGGQVARLGTKVPEMPTFMSAGAVTDKGVVRDVYAQAGLDITSLGFNVNFAPVADVTIGLADPIIRSRSAGSDPTNVAYTVSAASRGYLDAALMPAIKHFPGHGSVEVDSHQYLPKQNASVAKLAARDFIPFQRAIDDGVPMIMMAHISVGEWGGQPATLTPAAYAYLRNEMGFDGVIITDALNMGAITRTHNSAQSAVAALNAGADIVLMPPDLGAAHKGIVNAVNKGTLSRERLNEAAARSIAMMRWQESIVPVPDQGLDYARQLSASAATVVTPLCGRAIVGNKVTISGGYASERQALARALAEYGVATGSGGTSIKLMGSPSSGGTADIVVAMDGPWGLTKSSASHYVGLYGRSDAALAGLADVLAGGVDASGHWPVRVGNMPYAACPSPR